MCFILKVFNPKNILRALDFESFTFFVDWRGSIPHFVAGIGVRCLNAWDLGLCWWVSAPGSSEVLLLILNLFSGQGLELYTLVSMPGPRPTSRQDYLKVTGKCACKQSPPNFIVRSQCRSYEKKTLSGTVLSVSSVFRRRGGEQIRVPAFKTKIRQWWEFGRVSIFFHNQTFMISPQKSFSRSLILCPPTIWAFFYLLCTLDEKNDFHNCMISPFSCLYLPLASYLVSHISPTSLSVDSLHVVTKISRISLAPLCL